MRTRKATEAGPDAALQRPTAALVIGSALLAATAVLAATVAAAPGDPWLQPVDDWWRRTITPGGSDSVTGIAEAVTSAGNWPWTYVVLAIIVAPFLLRRRWQPAVYIVACVVLTTLVVNPALKVAVDRERPPDHLVEVTSLALPSGHASYAAVLAAAVVLAWRPRRSQWIWAAIAVAVLMMWSRTHLSVHWLTDTITGALLGFGIALTAFWVAYPWLGVTPRLYTAVSQTDGAI